MRTLFWVEKNAQNVFCHRLRTLVKLLVELGTALLIGPAENVPYFRKSSAIFNSETVLCFRWMFYNSFVCRSSDTIYLFHSNVESYWVANVPLQPFAETVLVEALLRDTCNARRALCILLNLSLCLAAVGQWTLGAEINKQLKLLFETTLTLRHSDVIVV